MISFSNVIRHVEINLRKNTKDLYCETTKYQFKKIERGTNAWGYSMDGVNSYY